MKWCCLVILFWVGCAEISAAPDRVRFVNHEPRCALIEAVEMRSKPDECTSREMLRAYAVVRGADRIVLDNFTVLDDDQVIAQGRLFACDAPH
jgi:hypothetical protein